MSFYYQLIAFRVFCVMLRQIKAYLIIQLSISNFLLTLLLSIVSISISNTREKFKIKHQTLSIWQLSDLVTASQKTSAFLPLNSRSNLSTFVLILNEFSSVFDVYSPSWCPSCSPAQGVQNITFEHCPKLLHSDNGISVIKFISLKIKNSHNKNMRKTKQKKKKSKRKKNKDMKKLKIPDNSVWR